LELGHVRFEPFVDSDEKTSEPLADCWLYLFWYTLRGEGAWTDEIYVDAQAKYHSIDLNAHKGKDVRPHAPKGTATLLLPFNDVRKKETVSFIHVPYASPFQLPWARLPAVPPGKTLGPKSSEFQTLLKWLSDERDILGRGCVVDDFLRERGVRVARFQSPWHRALALSWDLAVTESQIAAELRSDPQRAKLLVLNQVVNGFLKANKGNRFIDYDFFQKDRFHLQSFDALQDALDQRAKLLTAHLDGKAYGEIIGDVNAAGGEAYGRFRDTLAAVYDVLPSTSHGDHHLKELLDHSEGLFTDKNFKGSRKSLKAMWTFLKAVTKIANDRKLKPLRDWIVAWASEALPIKPRVNGRGFIQPNLFKDFEKKILDHLLAHLAFLLIDAYNMVVAVKDWQKEGKTSGLISPKAFSVASASFSLLGTTAGFSEALVKRRLTKAQAIPKSDLELLALEKDVGELGVRKNVFGVVGNVADTVGSTWQAYKKFELDDTNAGVAQVLCALGAGGQAVGYAITIVAGVTGGALACLVFGALFAAAGTGLYIVWENDDLENWMNHCWWGMGRNDKTTATTRWSQGSLELFHKDLDKQLIGLNYVFFGYTLDWEYRPIDLVFNRRPHAVLRATFSCLPDGTKVFVRIVGRSGGVDKELHPAGTWISAHLERDAHGKIVEMSEEFYDLHFDELVCESRLDIYGDGTQMLPPVEQEPQRARFHVPLIDHAGGVRTSA
jgi:hypothetical protein